MKNLDLEAWNRKEHFDFFKEYDQPFFGLTAEVDVTKAYQVSKKLNASFFLYYLHKSLVAVNRLESFKYRIIDEKKVVIVDSIRAGTTINRPDGTFSFSYLPFYEDFNVFEREALKVIDEIRKTTGLPHTDRSIDVAYFSAIPWVKFTSVEHAMHSKQNDSVPKFAFGKWELKDDKKVMPVAVHAHHALMDGVHVGQFYELFQQLLNDE